VQAIRREKLASSKNRYKNAADRHFGNRVSIVCNAIKLSQFTAVKMSHPRRVLSSLFAEILTV
jgi:hypothetical protein